MTTNGKTTALAVVDDNQVSVMVKQCQAIWPKDLSPQEQQAVARVALAYGLDPLAGELIVYRGKPYVTVDGRLRKARETGKWQGFIEDRPATPEEYKALHVSPGDMLWFISIKHSDWIRPNGAYGRVSVNDANPVAKQHPAEVARKRALYRCLREAFGMPLPGVYEDENVSATPTDLGDGQTIVNVMISSGQIAAIHAKTKELGWDEQEYRKQLIARTRKNSCTDLTQFEAEDFLAYLDEKAQRGPGPTDAQVDAFIADWERKEEADTSKRTQPTENPPKAEPDSRAVCAECGQPITDERRQGVDGKVQLFRAERVIEGCEKHLGKLYCLEHYQAKMAERTNLQTTLWSRLIDRASLYGIPTHLLPVTTLVEMQEHYDKLLAEVKRAEDAIPSGAPAGEELPL